MDSTGCVYVRVSVHTCTSVSACKCKLVKKSVIWEEVRRYRIRENGVNTVSFTQKTQNHFPIQEKNRVTYLWKGNFIVFSFGAADRRPGLAQVLSSTSVDTRFRWREVYLTKPSIRTTLRLDAHPLYRSGLLKSLLLQPGGQSGNTKFSEFPNGNQKVGQRMPMSTRGSGPPAETRFEAILVEMSGLVLQESWLLLANRVSFHP